MTSVSYEHDTTYTISNIASAVAVVSSFGTILVIRNVKRLRYNYRFAVTGHSTHQVCVKALNLMFFAADESWSFCSGAIWPMD